MKNWSVQNAKARFSEFLDSCLAQGPQVVTRRGLEAAVLVPMDEWRRLERSARLSLKELLLAEAPQFDLPPTRRGKRRRRPPRRLD